MGGRGVLLPGPGLPSLPPLSPPSEEESLLMELGEALRAPLSPAKTGLPKADSEEELNLK